MTVVAKSLFGGSSMVSACGQCHTDLTFPICLSLEDQVWLTLVANVTSINGCG